jgi:enamine deaminase RidA (YjgF/YER057c/UK114 family)
VQTTDIDGFMEHYEVDADWIDPSGVMPPQSLMGVARLVMPELLVEIEVQAAA